jgi:hypothetical protein
MWRRTKRLIESYLDNLIDRAGNPESEVREITRAELARLIELEAQSMASAKILEKEIADIELKLVGFSERERIARERGDQAAATSAGSHASALTAERDMLKQKLAEARAAAAKARALREERKTTGETLATETHLTSMRESLAGVQGAFDATDPAATLDEMRARIGASAGPSLEDSVADADRELEAQNKQKRTDDMLARYKQNLTQDEHSPAPRPVSSTDIPPSEPAADDKEKADNGKTLGPARGPVRPID